MRILILGAGATGGYFGGRLAANGSNVTFLVRERRAAALARDGLVIESPLGNWQGPVKTVTAAGPSQDFDVVILSCKAYDLDQAILSIKPFVGADTMVLPLLNGLNHLDILDAAFGKERVLGGLCHISVTLSPDGHVQHLNKLQLLTFGPRHESQQRLCEALLPEMKRAGFKVILSDNPLQDMWEKFVMLATLAATTVPMRASIGEIVATSDGKDIIVETLEECRAVAKASGHEPRASQFEGARTNLTEPASAVSASMRRDLEGGGRIEADHIVGDMLRRARAAGIAAPNLRSAYCHLQCYQNRLR